MSADAGNVEKNHKTKDKHTEGNNSENHSGSVELHGKIRASHVMSDGKYLYSVYLAIRFINETQMFRPMSFRMSALKHVLESRCWVDPQTGHMFSPRDVLDNPKKYAARLERIKNTDLQYPIIIEESGRLFDGHHRVSKAFIQNMPDIHGYVLPHTIRDLFRVGVYRDRLKLLTDITYTDLDSIYDKNIRNWSQSIGVEISPHT